uniref:MICOS complex subunit n=1 Tax=Cacopsylla melanoneura TaxID=428564 RepID=A0A8D8X7W7_9HEMI
MFSKVLKVFLPTSPFLLAATPVVGSSEANPPPQLEEKKIKRSELPIYPKEECECKKAPLVLKEESNAMLEGISVVRKEIQDLFGQSGDVINRGVLFINTGIAHTSAQIDFLRDEDNIFPRIGAITGGTLLGLLFAIRKGFFKKLIYATTGGLTMASVCYPKEADEYSAIAFVEAKKYTLVGYHFLNGVSKDLIGYEFPELSSLTEASPSKPVLKEPTPSSKPLAALLTLPAPPLEVPESKAK